MPVEDYTTTASTTYSWVWNAVPSYTTSNSEGTVGWIPIYDMPVRFEPQPPEIDREKWSEFMDSDDDNG